MVSIVSTVIDWTIAVIAKVKQSIVLYMVMVIATLLIHVRLGTPKMDAVLLKMIAIDDLEVPSTLRNQATHVGTTHQATQTTQAIGSPLNTPPGATPCCAACRIPSRVSRPLSRFGPKTI